MITTRQVTKRFGAVLAVDRVDLDVREGDRYGLLGPNGSGKTTLIRMLLGLVFATSGEIEVDGCPVPRKIAQVLPKIGALIEGPASYGYLNGRANLALLDAAGPGGGRRTRKARIDEALERVGLAGVDRRPVRAYSLGMRQRLGLAGALLRTPTLLILDEPTNGLDPRGIREIRDLLIELNKAGTTILLSSHLLGEIEQLCTRIGVLDRGRMVIQDQLEVLRAPTDRIVLHTPDADRAVALLDGTLLDREGDRLVVRGDDPAGLNARLVGEGLRVAELVRERRSLEELVVEATQPGSDRLDQYTPMRAAAATPHGDAASNGATASSSATASHRGAASSNGLAHESEAAPDVAAAPEIPEHPEKPAPAETPEPAE